MEQVETQAQLVTLVTLVPQVTLAPTVQPVTVEALVATVVAEAEVEPTFLPTVVVPLVQQDLVVTLVVPVEQMVPVTSHLRVARVETLVVEMVVRPAQEHLLQFLMLLQILSITALVVVPPTPAPTPQPPAPAPTPSPQPTPAPAPVAPIEGSAAWWHHGLRHPARSGGWTRTADGLTCCVEQGHYGHRARKATWLYAVGIDDPPDLRWGPCTAAARCSEANASSRPSKVLERLGHRERRLTPPAFAAWPVELARSARINASEKEGDSPPRSPTA